jgi:hypothetical protein
MDQLLPEFIKTLFLREDDMQSLFSVMPLRTRPLNKKMDVLMWREYEPGIAEINALWVLPRFSVVSRFQIVRTWTQKGCAEEFEGIGLNTDEGKAAAVDRIRNMLDMLQNDLVTDILVGLRQAPVDWTTYAMDGRQTLDMQNSSPEDLFNFAFKTHNIFELSDRPVAELVELVRPWMQGRHNGYFDTMIIPDAIAGALKLKETNVNYANAGPDASSARKADIDNPAQLQYLVEDAPGVRAVKISTTYQTLKQQMMYQTTTTSTISTFGEFYLLGSRTDPSDPNWGPWCETIGLMDKAKNFNSQLLTLLHSLIYLMPMVAFDH